MNQESPTLSPAHRKLLQAIYNRFNPAGVWPTTRSVRLEIRRDGELTELCRELGGKFIVCALGDSATGVCELRVHALLYVEGAEHDKALIASVVQYLVKRYIEESESSSSVEVSGTDFETALGLTEQEARRVTRWIDYAPMITSTFTPDLPDRRATLTVSPEILRLEGVKTFEDYLERADEIEQTLTQRAMESGGKVKALFRGEGLLMRTRGPGVVFDTLELHGAVRERVEQLFLDGHHLEAVRTALTVLEVRVREMLVAHGLAQSEIPATPAALMAKAFSEKDPVIRLNERTTPFERDEQRGFQFLAQGVMAWPRGSLTHELPDMRAADALERLALVSLLMKRLDRVEQQARATGLS